VGIESTGAARTATFHHGLVRHENNVGGSCRKALARTPTWVNDWGFAPVENIGTAIACRISRPSQDGFDPLRIGGTTTGQS